MIILNTDVQKKGKYNNDGDNLTNLGNNFKSFSTETPCIFINQTSADSDFL